jgi:hypothetical protein
LTTMTNFMDETDTETNTDDDASSFLSEEESVYGYLSDDEDEEDGPPIYFSNPYGITIDEVDEFVMDEIDCIEQYVWESKPPPKYVIGVSNVFMDIYSNVRLLGCYVSAYTFYKYNYTVLYNYLLLTTIFAISAPFRKIDIIQICEYTDENGVTVDRYIIKTFWLRIIQRRWKKIYKEKMERIESRKQWSTISYFELYGRYPNGLNNVPSICGMLSDI